MSLHDEGGLMSDDFIATPAKGSGPGIAVLYSDPEMAGAVDALCRRLGEEGYVAVGRAVPADADDPPAQAAADAVVSAVRDRLEFRGRIGALGIGGAAKAAIALAFNRLIDALVLYDPPASGALLDGLSPLRLPCAVHLAGPGTGGLAEKAAEERAFGPAVTLYGYETSAPRFGMPGSRTYDAAASALAWSRTVSAFKRAMGPHFALEELWEYHLACEFRLKDADEAIATMVDEPYVNHVPTLTGGFGREPLRTFYARHFVNQVPGDRRSIPISRTVGYDRIVDEKIFCFTHDAPIDWMLPGVEPTGKYVEIPLVGIVTFRGDKLVNEHLYWDQASVLVQTGLLDPRGLPVTGQEQAQKLIDPSRPSNTLIPGYGPA
jgi:carboxymethylenebutenolidase